ncbi:MAG: hypothetical protein WB439_01385 [Acidobacteriaceae bacterium]
MKSGLYVITGLVMAFVTLFLVMEGIWGAPVSPLEYIAFLGAIALVVAGILHIWKRSFGTKLVIVSLLMVWTFYLPAFVHTFGALPGQFYSDYEMYKSITAMGVRFPSSIVMGWVRVLLSFTLLISSTIVAMRDGLRGNRFYRRFL